MIWGNASAVTFIASLTFHTGRPEKWRRQFYCAARKTNKTLVCFGILRVSRIEVGVYFGWWDVLNLEPQVIKDCTTSVTLETDQSVLSPLTLTITAAICLCFMVSMSPCKWCTSEECFQNTTPLYLVILRPLKENWRDISIVTFSHTHQHDEFGFSAAPQTPKQLSHVTRFQNWIRNTAGRPVGFGWRSPTCWLESKWRCLSGGVPGSALWMAVLLRSSGIGPCNAGFLKRSHLGMS